MYTDSSPKDGLKYIIINIIQVMILKLQSIMLTWLKNWKNKGSIIKPYFLNMVLFSNVKWFLIDFKPVYAF